MSNTEFLIRKRKQILKLLWYHKMLCHKLTPNRIVYRAIKVNTSSLLRGDLWDVLVSAPSRRSRTSCRLADIWRGETVVMCVVKMMTHSLTDCESRKEGKRENLGYGKSFVRYKGKATALSQFWWQPKEMRKTVRFLFLWLILSRNIVRYLIFLDVSFCFD